VPLRAFSVGRNFKYSPENVETELQKLVRKQGIARTEDDDDE
jgi:hypothetical protein